MNQEIKKMNIIAYAENIVAPSLIEDATLEKEISDDHGDTDVWLLTCDTMEEYWAFEGDMPTNIVKKAGIYENLNHAYDVYIEMQEDTVKGIDVKDRYQYEKQKS